ncbi:MAG TPA: hypothetical protein VLX92_31580 [Kofleriaceae bacterium]|nr:hypothetical protein [Kofleriaceae bacterium]
MAAIVVAGCAITIAYGERIGINDGQGWDGMTYAQWAIDFWKSVVVDGVTRYGAQRVLPSAIVHYGLVAAGYAPTARQVITGFQLLDAALLAGAALLWAHLGGVMRWSRGARWVGFVALFGGFANARHALYYPTLTDPMAFFLGMAMVWAYLANRPIALWLVIAAGIVTWPALPPLAAALLVFPRAEVAPLAEGSKLARWRVPGARAIAGAVVAGFLGYAWYYLEHPSQGLGDEKLAAWVRRDLLVLTVPGLVALLGLGAYVVVAQPRLWNVRGYLRALALRRTALALAGIAALIVLRAWWLGAIGTQGDGPSGAQFGCELTLAALRGPLWGLVHHVVYFGPIVLVAAIAWPAVARTASAWGPIACVGLGMIVVFAAGSNSRQWIHLLPLLVALAIAATHDRWTPRRALAFAAIALAWSKLWLHIGYDRIVSFWEFPNQRYFMNTGPYASDTMYLVHLIAAAVTAALVFALLRVSSPSAPRSDRPG